MNLLAALTLDEKLFLTGSILIGIVFLCLLSYSIGYFRCYERMQGEREKESEFDDRIGRFMFCETKLPEKYELN